MRSSTLTAGFNMKLFSPWKWLAEQLHVPAHSEYFIKLFQKKSFVLGSTSPWERFFHAFLLHLGNYNKYNKLLSFTRDVSEWSARDCFGTVTNRNVCQKYIQDFSSCVSVGREVIWGASTFFSAFADSFDSFWSISRLSFLGCDRLFQ